MPDPETLVIFAALNRSSTIMREPWRKPRRNILWALQRVLDVAIKYISQALQGSASAAGVQSPHGTVTAFPYILTLDGAYRIPYVDLVVNRWYVISAPNFSADTVHTDLAY